MDKTKLVELALEARHFFLLPLFRICGRSGAAV